MATPQLDLPTFDPSMFASAGTNPAASAAMGAAFPWGSLIEAGAGLVGGYYQGSANKRAYKKQINMQNEAARRALGQLQFGTALEESQIKAANKTRMGGFQGARNALTLGSTVAQQGIKQRGVQNQAATEQSLVSRGLIGTSTGTQQFAGIGNQTSAALAGVDAQLAEAFANLGLQESQTEAAGQLQLADLQRQKTEALFQLYQSADPFGKHLGTKRNKWTGAIS